MKRHSLPTWLLAPVVALVCLASVNPARGRDPSSRPNIVIVLADDMGWRDTGYNGNPVVKTPHLDAMAAKGLRFDYFYPGGQMCSPGRYAILTGRSPFRCGLSALGPIRPQETILARALKQAGYRSALFGKWHLGGKETTPIKMGFDQATWSGNYYDIDGKLQLNDSGEKLTVKGDSSVFTMDLALEYIRKQAAEKQPFLAYVAFGSPHGPHSAAPEFKALYKDLPEKDQHFWGEISGLDAAVGKLRAELKKLDIADNTIVWFTSDNGGISKESMDPSGKGKMTVGCRIPGLLEWPARIKQPVRTTLPCGHVDMYPTLLELTGVKVESQPVLDGISLVPLLDGQLKERPKPMGFLLWLALQNGKVALETIDFTRDPEGVWIDGPYKLIVPARKDGSEPVRLHDIYADPGHKVNLAEKLPDVVKRMRGSLEEWQRSVRASFDGKDFADKK